MSSNYFDEVGNVDYNFQRFEYNDDYETIMKIYRKWSEKDDTIAMNRETNWQNLCCLWGSTTDLVLSGNYQALYEFLQLRLCERAEWKLDNWLINLNIYWQKLCRLYLKN
ncbi:FAD-dependent thymidylate synthase [Desulfofarcimen acetoxidans]|uniref:FAD-dependent thymidylate synthase n=1 Tax=Desulfofarcimen acetoxidans TaxID=58138 RepID=UPI00068A6530|nr:FAD-dependent thymidylate synthase [Desulfofarcimen acetoxidans]